METPSFHPLKIIRRISRKFFWNAPTFLIPLLVQLRFGTRFKHKVKLRQVNGILKLTEIGVEEKKVSTIHFFHPLRVTRYFQGIDFRIAKLLEEYCVNQIPDLKTGVFLDIGSNVGEFSLGIAQRFPSAKFVRFEPSHEECLASERNMSIFTDQLFQTALWKEETTLHFYRRNENGDSSLFSPDNESDKISLTTKTLDSLVKDLNICEIELVKLEAEGAEPEILIGGEETFKKSRYVCADLGPERGILQEKTFDEANVILLSYGFKLIGRNKGARECYLYKNTLMQ